MGTNYYAIQKVDDYIKTEMKLCIDREDFATLRKLITDKCEEVHIGKSAIGWQFIFNNNAKRFYNETQNSIVAFLEKCEIVDEYKREISLKDFWDLVMSKMQSKADLDYGHMSDGLNFSNFNDFS